MDNWISVKERFPEDEQPVLVWGYNHRETEGDYSLTIFVSDREGPRFLCGGFRVTHWMSLPEPPK
jgi:hypothetical protein